MPSIRIGRTEIDYDLRRSSSATERRITVTPGHVEVLALASDSDDDVAGFLDRKRQWLFTTVKDVERLTLTPHAVPRFITGSKIPFRGRKMSLTVRRTDADRAVVTYRNGFVVDLPHWAGDSTDSLVASELKHWLKQRARREVQATAAHHEKRSGLKPRSIRVADMVNGWGSCGREGNILIDWHLIFAPSKVMEYVVAHELAHLRVRTHGPDFWALLASIYGEVDDPKSWLETQGASLSSEFLTA